MSKLTCLIPLFLFILQLGCVPKQKYEDQLAVAASLEQQVAQLERELGDTKTQLASVSQQLDAEKARSAELSALSTTLSEQNADLEARLKELAEKLTALRARGRTEQQAKAELEAMVAALQQRSEAASAEVASAEGRIATLEEEQAKLAAEAARLAAEAAKLAAEKAKLEKKSAEYDSLVASLKSEIDSGLVTITELSGKLTVNLSNAILFDTGSFDLKAEGQAAIDKIAGVLAGVTSRDIRVEGHTDDVPVRAGASFKSNWGLSSLRASTVVAQLVGSGVDPLNIAAVGLGEHHPIQPNETEEGKAANRRTEILLVPKLAAAGTVGE